MIRKLIDKLIAKFGSDTLDLCARERDKYRRELQILKTEIYIPATLVEISALATQERSRIDRKKEVAVNTLIKLRDTFELTMIEIVKGIANLTPESEEKK